MIPRLDMVIAHETNFGRTRRRISHPDYFETVNMIVAARCERQC